MTANHIKTKLKESYNLSRVLGIHRETQDRVKGVLLGLAAGDRIGGPTQMASLLGQSLAENSTFVSKDVAINYVDWWTEKGFDTGGISERVFSLVSQEMPLTEAINKVDQESQGMTAGCNPAHRNTPIAMSASLRDDEIGEIAERESSLTHKHHLAGLVSSTSVQLARSLIRGTTWSEAIMIMENISSPVICDIFKATRNGKIFSDGFSPHVFGAAVHFISTSNSFDEMLERAIDFSGEENYCAVLAGSLGGARWGASSISEYWLMGLEGINEINAVAQSLAEDW